MNKIVLDANNFDRMILDDFIQALEKATGSHVITKAVIEVTCDDPKAAAIIQTVFGGNGQVAIARQQKEKKTENTEKPAGMKTRIDIPYKVLDGPQAGMKVKGGPLSRMIKAGSLGANTHLQHPDKGLFIITPNRQLIPCQADAIA
jgi:hypothetical protein